MNRDVRLGETELEPVELLVEARRLDQLGMGSGLDDASLVEDDDPVGALDGRETVRDDEHRAPREERLQRLLHEQLRLRVEAGGRLVEEKQPRVLVDGPRDRDALALAAREPDAPVADQGLVALPHLLDEAIGVRGARGAVDRVGLGVRDAIGDVVPHRVVEEDRLLRHPPRSERQDERS